jgi:hypothetical protein
MPEPRPLSLGSTRTIITNTIEYNSKRINPTLDKNRLLRCNYLKKATFLPSLD